MTIKNIRPRLHNCFESLILGVFILLMNEGGQLAFGVQCVN